MCFSIITKLLIDFNFNFWRTIAKWKTFFKFNLRFFVSAQNFHWCSSIWKSRGADACVSFTTTISNMPFLVRTSDGAFVWVTRWTWSAIRTGERFSSKFAKCFSSKIDDYVSSKILNWFFVARIGQAHKEQKNHWSQRWHVNFLSGCMRIKWLKQ